MCLGPKKKAYTPTAGSQIMSFTTNWGKIGAEALGKEVSVS
jgi:hypothetical protein